VYTRDAKCPGDCGSGVFIAQEIDGVWGKGSGDTTLFKV
jgi:ribosomal protein S27AE